MFSTFLDKLKLNIIINYNNNNMTTMMMISVVDKRQLYVRETAPNIVIVAMKGKNIIFTYSRRKRCKQI